jgi:alkylation response protein AidB-like acyl-CoA dehydrogenase
MASPPPPTIAPVDPMFLSAVADMCARKIAPTVESTAPDRAIDAATLRACLGHVASTGYFGARVTEAAGGSGLPLIATGAVTEALPTFLAVACIAQEATTFRVASSGNVAMHERYLPRMISGELIAGSCISEPDVGSGSNDIRTTIRSDGPGRARLRGVKMWSTNAPVADVLVVLARDESGQLVRIVLDPHSDGVQINPVDTTGLLRGHLAEVVLDVSVSDDVVLTSSTRARTVLQSSWGLNRASMGLAASALLRSALDAATRYSTERVQFGAAIGGFQLIQGLLADAWAAWQASRLLAYHALAVLDGGDTATKEASAAKLFGTEAAVTHIGKLQQIAGSYGITPEFPFSQWLADASMLVFPDGTPQIQRLIMGRDIVGISAFGSRTARASETTKTQPTQQPPEPDQDRACLRAPENSTRSIR